MQGLTGVAGRLEQVAAGLSQQVGVAGEQQQFQRDTQTCKLRQKKITPIKITHHTWSVIVRFIGVYVFSLDFAVISEGWPDLPA